MIFRDKLLNGQRILVTGGGSGLGRVMANAFCELGATCYIAGRRGPILSSTADELNASTCGRAVPIECDIRSPSAITQMIDTIWADGGELTGLVNNAAGNFIARTEDLSVNGFNAIANTVFHGSFYVTLEVAKRWIKSPETTRTKSIISILATWVRNGSPYTVPSAMSKTALRAMTESLAVEWASKNIRLNAIAPGLFPTEGATKRLRPEGRPSDAPEFSEGIPMMRYGRMQELANLAVFLMSDGADYLTGETIAIDGGRYLASAGNFWPLTQLSDSEWQERRDKIVAADRTDKSMRSAGTL